MGEVTKDRTLRELRLRNRRCWGKACEKINGQIEKNYQKNPKDKPQKGIDPCFLSYYVN